MAKLFTPTQQRMHDRMRETVQTMTPASVGIELALAVLLGLGVGWWIDGRLGTYPAFLAVFLIFGLVAGFRAVWREAVRAMPDNPPPEDQP